MKAINLPYAGLIGIFTALGAIIGVTQSNRIVKVTGRQSVIVFFLALTIAVAFVALPIKYLMQ